MASSVPFKMSHSPSDSRSCYGTETYLDRLPLETLGMIIEYVDSDDLFNLCLACRSFHELAAARLYRHISHAFNVLDNKVARESLDQFTAILETLLASEYGYARFIRHVSLERVNMTDVSRGEVRTAGNDSGYTSGKLLNTLMLLVLKRATGLESFKWDIRVELNPSIFEVLGKIPTLQTLHVRFPIGFLPFSPGYNIPMTPSLPTIPPAPLGPGHNANPGNASTESQETLINNAHHLHPGSGSQLIHPQYGQPNPVTISKEQESFNTCEGRHSFSLFSGLRELSVLDIDDLECISELAQCLSSSYSSIRSLKLSISDRVALKARGRNTGELPETGSMSEHDDGELNNPNPAQPPLPPPALGGPVPANGASSASAINDQLARLARVVQEAILATIFNLGETEHQQHRDQGLEEAILYEDEKAWEAAKPLIKAEEDRIFVKTLRNMARALPAAVRSGSGSSKSLKTLDLIDKAATRYLERTSEQDNHAEPSVASASGSGSKNPALVAIGSNISQETGALIIHGSSMVPPQAAGTSQNVGAATTSTSAETDQGAPDIPSVVLLGVHNETSNDLSDIIDMENSDNIEDSGEDQESVTDGDDGSISDGPNGVTDNILGAETESAQPDPESLLHAKYPKEKEASRDLNHANIDNEAGFEISEGQSLVEYVRSTHGMPLDSLSLHQIPMKATVLCRAVDPFVLKHLSLLNVGPQRALWAMLGQLNRLRPLQLSSIHTDNVTYSFLSFVNGLDRVDEIFMFQCSSRSKVESFAPKSTVSIDVIKREILIKHIKGLRRLVIRNDQDSTWVLNSHTARLVAGQGNNLIELGVGLDNSGYHHFVQDIKGLHSLVALQIFYHHTDTYPTMLRELRSCVVDNILQFEHLRIEYVAMCYSVHGPGQNSAVQITYPSPLGVGFYASQQNMTSNNVGTAAKKKFVVPDDDNEIGDGPVNMVIKGIKIHEIVGIKMWEKEIWTMKL